MKQFDEEGFKILKTKKATQMKCQEYSHLTRFDLIYGLLHPF
jgi:hypothetical protein